MERIALILYGNIASGKSSVCRLLEEELEDFKHVCLDKNRIGMWKRFPKMGIGQRDLMAQEECMAELHGNLIFETTAVTRFFAQAKAHLLKEGYTLRYVHLDCPPAKCLERYKRRVNSGKIQAPFAWGKYSIAESIHYFAAKQQAVPAALRLNTTRVRPEVAARLIAEWVENGFTFDAERRA